MKYSSVYSPPPIIIATSKITVMTVITRQAPVVFCQHVTLRTPGHTANVVPQLSNQQLSPWNNIVLKVYTNQQGCFTLQGSWSTGHSTHMDLLHLAVWLD